MSTKLGISTKRLQIDKANATVTLVIAIASFITISSLVAIKTLSAKRSYQARVLKAKVQARNQLVKNKTAVTDLKTAYDAFVGETTNAIGGLSAGKGDRDGDNAKITLDALPSKYDFPALTSSIEKLLASRNFKIKNISGSDDEVAQKNISTTNPEPIEMPIEFSVIGSYQPFVDLLKVLEKTIRPVHVNSLILNADQSEMTLEVKAKTYYLPEKALNINTKDVK